MILVKDPKVLRPAKFVENRFLQIPFEWTWNVKITGFRRRKDHPFTHRIVDLLGWLAKDGYTSRR